MSYRWRPGANCGGGFGQVGDAQGDEVVVIGDMWGAARSHDGAKTWRAQNLGAPSVPTGRAVILSKRPATRGWAFMGIGPSHGASPGQGYFGVQSPEGRIRAVDGSPYGFALNVENANAITPRPAGTTIVTDYDSTNDVERIYACSPTAISRYTNDATHPMSGTFSPVRIRTIAQCWRAAVVIDPDHLMVATFTKNANGVAQTPKVFMLTGIRGSSATMQQIKSALAVNALRWIGGRLYAVCSSGLYRIEQPANPNSTWTRLGWGFFDDILLDICGVGDTLYVGQANGGLNLQPGHAVAKSVDGGKSWRWTAGMESPYLYGSGIERWWLSSSAGGISDDSYDTSQMAMAGDTVLSFGRRGCWASPDAGGTWFPAVKGLGGTSNPHVVVQSGGTVNTEDEDWTAAVSTDRFLTAKRGLKVQYPPIVKDGNGNITRIVGGATYKVIQASPCDITRNGVSIADDVFRAWAVKGNVEDLAVGPDGTAYVASSGGSLLVGDPV